MPTIQAERERLAARIAALEDENSRLRARLTAGDTGVGAERQSVADAYAGLSGSGVDFVQMLEQLPVGVMIADPTGRTLFRNRALHDMWRGARSLVGFEDWTDYAAWDAVTGRPIGAQDWPLAMALIQGAPVSAQAVDFRRFDGTMGRMLVSAEPVRDTAGVVVSGVAIAQDISELQAAEAQITLDRELLKQIGETTPDLIYAKDRQSRMIFANPAVLKATGRAWEEIAGRPDTDWHPDPEEAAQFVEDDELVMSSGITRRFEEVLTGPEGTETFLSSKTPMKDPSGVVIGLFGISKNITAEKRLDAQRLLLMQELNHRLKNMLAMVQAIAQMTLKPALRTEDVWRVFDGRIQVLAGASDVLIRQSWDGAEIGGLVNEALRAHGCGPEGRILAEGPEVWVDAQVAMGLSLALHELCTNAVKYGALSVDSGRVQVAWRSLDDLGNRVAISWRELGGPTVAPPARRGFGSRLIEQAFGDGAARARVDYDPAGVRFEVEAPTVPPPHT
jgi:PAS domain S-box-containing protein